MCTQLEAKLEHLYLFCAELLEEKAVLSDLSSHDTVAKVLP